MVMIQYQPTAEEQDEKDKSVLERPDQTLRRIVICLIVSIVVYGLGVGAHFLSRHQVSDKEAAAKVFHDKIDKEIRHKAGYVLLNISPGTYRKILDLHLNAIPYRIKEYSYHNETKDLTVMLESEELTNGEELTPFGKVTQDGTLFKVIINAFE